MVSVLTSGYHICIRMWKKLYYRPIHLVFSFIQPLFWLTIFGFLFEKKVSIPGVDYLSYLLPGILGMTVLQSSSQSGILFIKDFQTGFFGRYNFTPIAKSSLLFFKILADFSRIVVQVIVISIIGYLVGIKTISVHLEDIPLILGATFLFTYFYASLSCFIALKTKTSELMATFVHLFNLPIIFTSTALIPNKGLPNWLARIAEYNPLSHLSNILRDVMVNINLGQTDIILSFSILIALAGVSFFCAVQMLSSIKYD